MLCEFGSVWARSVLYAMNHTNREHAHARTHTAHTRRSHILPLLLFGRERASGLYIVTVCKRRGRDLHAKPSALGIVSPGSAGTEDPGTTGLWIVPRF